MNVSLSTPSLLAARLRSECDIIARRKQQVLCFSPGGQNAAHSAPAASAETTQRSVDFPRHPASLRLGGENLDTRRRQLVQTHMQLSAAAPRSRRSFHNLPMPLPAQERQERKTRISVTYPFNCVFQQCSTGLTRDARRCASPSGFAYELVWGLRPAAARLMPGACSCFGSCSLKVDEDPWGSPTWDGKFSRGPWSWRDCMPCSEVMNNSEYIS